MHWAQTYGNIKTHLLWTYIPQSSGVNSIFKNLSPHFFLLFHFIFNACLLSYFLTQWKVEHITHVLPSITFLSTMAKSFDGLFRKHLKSFVDTKDTRQYPVSWTPISDPIIQNSDHIGSDFQIWFGSSAILRIFEYLSNFCRIFVYKIQ